MMKRTSRVDLYSLFGQRPNAAALVRGSDSHSSIYGLVCFYDTSEGTLVRFDVRGLPARHGKCESDIFACHIHSGSSCSGNFEDPFADALMHFDPEGCPHPSHAGDMPPLFSCGGHAFQVFLTDRFTARDIIGRNVIIHSSPDDFTTQPSGNSGEKIACGVIRRMR